MRRKTVAISDLETLISEEMAKHKTCGGGTHIGVYLREEDEIGCNWGIRAFKDVPGDPRQCWCSISDAIDTLRARYKVRYP